jgi:hypothetical protein
LPGPGLGPADGPGSEHRGSESGCRGQCQCQCHGHRHGDWLRRRAPLEAQAGASSGGTITGIMIEPWPASESPGRQLPVLSPYLP